MNFHTASPLSFYYTKSYPGLARPKETATLTEVKEVDNSK